MSKLYWLDLETTGLDTEHDWILEIAVSVADIATPFDAKPLYHAVLGAPSSPLSAFILDMHTKNGLLKECSISSKWPEDVYYELMPLIPEAKDNYLAGNSVHFDAAFLKTWMPGLAKRFSHRHYDVSAVNLFALSLGMPALPKETAHRAKDDIEASIRQAKALAAWLEGRTT